MPATTFLLRPPRRYFVRLLKNHKYLYIRIFFYISYYYILSYFYIYIFNAKTFLLDLPLYLIRILYPCKILTITFISLYLLAFILSISVLISGFYFKSTIFTKSIISRHTTPKRHIRNSSATLWRNRVSEYLYTQRNVRLNGKLQSP